MSEVFIHETACVDQGASVGDGSRIWHFVHVLPGSRIGRNCILGQNVMVGPDVTIGDGCKVQNNVSVYPGVTLEDEVFCGPSMVFTNVRTPRSAFPRNKSDDYLRTLVGRGATIGANATVVCGVTVGAWAFVAAGAVVTKDVAPFALMAGVPAKQIGWVCKCGTTLKFNGSQVKCAVCDRRYAIRDGQVAEQVES